MLPAEFFLAKMKPYSVFHVTRWIKRRVEDGNHQLLVKGEVSNFSRARSGHLYFTLKDPDAEIQAIVWKNLASALPFEIKEGLQIIVSCSVMVYEKKGEAKLNVLQMYLLDQEGALRQAFLQLKNKLSNEGLFEFLRKKPFPQLPARIAIVTSPEGAAIWDVWTMIKKRFARISILIFPVLVQGKHAPASIITALQELNRRKEVEMIILTRGGGSLEDLQAFNEESVARAIFASEIPILSAIGHESDVTISDYVADGRALTPTEAGVKCVPEEKELRFQLEQYQLRLLLLLQKTLQTKKYQYQSIATRLHAQNPQQKMQQRRKELGYLQEKLEKIMNQRLEMLRHQLQEKTVQLDSLSPLKVLSRGYSLTTKKNQQIVRSTKDVKKGEELQILLSKGYLTVQVSDIYERNEFEL
ncbi:MAG: exodeoxyribonuclease VII large subunit [Planctomycetota bacterium]